MKLVAENLQISRGEDVILSGVHFTLTSGQALVVEGPNGGGKSTLLRALAGLLPLDKGTITFISHEEFADANLPDALHYLGHDNAMKADISVRDNLAFWQTMNGTHHLRPAEALDLVGLSGLDDVPFGHLSTGQRRRVAIARLLVSWRPIWLLDEPTAGLDARAQAQFSAIMDTHLDDGGIIIAATHINLAVERVSHLDVGEYQASIHERDPQ